MKWYGFSMNFYDVANSIDFRYERLAFNTCTIASITQITYRYIPFWLMYRYSKSTNREPSASNLWLWYLTYLAYLIKFKYRRWSFNCAWRLCSKPHIYAGTHQMMQVMGIIEHVQLHSITVHFGKWTTNDQVIRAYFGGWVREHVYPGRYLVLLLWGENDAFYSYKRQEGRRVHTWLSRIGLDGRCETSWFCLCD